MNVRIDGARRQDQPFAGDGLGRDANDHVARDARHHVGVAGLADAGDPAVLDPHVRFPDPGPVDDQGVGDHRIERCLVSNTCRLPHAVTENLAGTEHALVAIRRIVPFHFRDERRVGEMNAIAGGRTIQVDVVTTIDAAAHWSSWC